MLRDTIPNAAIFSAVVSKAAFLKILHMLLDLTEPWAGVISHRLCCTKWAKKLMNSHLMYYSGLAMFLLTISGIITGRMSSATKLSCSTI